MWLLEQNLHMRVTICEYKYFKKCVNADRNLLLYKNIQKTTFKKFSLKEIKRLMVQTYLQIKV